MEWGGNQAKLSRLERTKKRDKTGAGGGIKRGRGDAY
jgi:hypothetical protein